MPRWYASQTSCLFCLSPQLGIFGIISAYPVRAGSYRLMPASHPVETSCALIIRSIRQVVGSPSEALVRDGVPRLHLFPLQPKPIVVAALKHCHCVGFTEWHYLLSIVGSAMAMLHLCTGRDSADRYSQSRTARVVGSARQYSAQLEAFEQA